MAKRGRKKIESRKDVKKSQWYVATENELRLYSGCDNLQTGRAMIRDLVRATLEAC